MTIALITPADAARDYRRQLGHIYVLASRHGWHRIRWQGRVYYDLNEVDAVLGRDPDAR
jgi:hypothetical protein